MKRRTFITTILMALAVSVSGQEKKHLETYHLFELQGGAQMTANGNMMKLISPTAAFSYGYMSPSVGLRLHVNGWQAKNSSDYKYKYVDVNGDLLLNVSYLFSRNANRKLNLYLVCGFGIASVYDREYSSTNSYDLSDNLRGGLRLETNITKPIGFSIEVSANSMGDRNNGLGSDWGFLAMLGVSYRFGKRYAKPTPILVPVVQDAMEVSTASMAPATYAAEEYIPEPQPTPKPEAKLVVKSDKLHETIYYAICMSDPTEGGKVQLQKVAQFMEQYKDAIIKIVGYADKGTGNPDVNMRYSKQRAIECKDVLVKSYGCNPENIIIDSKGDTVQPFEENEKNRCVIIDSEIKYNVQE